jgi:hypothetical protein
MSEYEFSVSCAPDGGRWSVSIDQPRWSAPNTIDITGDPDSDIYCEDMPHSIAVERMERFVSDDQKALAALRGKHLLSGDTTQHYSLWAAARTYQCPVCGKTDIIAPYLPDFSQKPGQKCHECCDGKGPTT